MKKFESYGIVNSDNYYVALVTPEEYDELLQFFGEERSAVVRYVKLDTQGHPIMALREHRLAIDNLEILPPRSGC